MVLNKYKIHILFCIKNLYIFSMYKYNFKSLGIVCFFFVLFKFKLVYIFLNLYNFSDLIVFHPYFFILCLV